MSRLNEDQVERLLKEAARWEPDAQLPESLIRSALTRSPRRKHIPLLPALSLCSAACAGLLAFVVFRPEVPPTVVDPTPAVASPAPVLQNQRGEDTPPGQPKKTITGPTVVADNTDKPSTVSKPSPRPERTKRNYRKRSHRRSSESTIRSPRQEARPDSVEYAPDTSTNEAKPLPENAISLDESPKIVPVVVADTDPETGEVLLRPAAALVPHTSADAPISLE